MVNQMLVSRRWAMFSDGENLAARILETNPPDDGSENRHAMYTVYTEDSLTAQPDNMSWLT